MIERKQPTPTEQVIKKEKDETTFTKLLTIARKVPHLARLEGIARKTHFEQYHEVKSFYPVTQLWLRDIERLINEQHIPWRYRFSTISKQNQPDERSQYYITDQGLGFRLRKIELKSKGLENSVWDCLRELFVFFKQESFSGADAKRYYDQGLPMPNRLTVGNIARMIESQQPIPVGLVSLKPQVGWEVVDVVTESLLSLEKSAQSVSTYTSPLVLHTVESGDDIFLTKVEYPDTVKIKDVHIGAPVYEIGM